MLPELLVRRSGVRPERLRSRRWMIRRRRNGLLVLAYFGIPTKSIDILMFAIPAGLRSPVPPKRLTREESRRGRASRCCGSGTVVRTKRVCRTSLEKVAEDAGVTKGAVPYPPFPPRETLPLRSWSARGGMLPTSRRTERARSRRPRRFGASRGELPSVLAPPPSGSAKGVRAA